MCSVSDNSTVRACSRVGLRFVGGEVSPVTPKTGLIGESGAVLGPAGVAVTCCEEQGCGEWTDWQGGPAFTTWPSAVLKARHGRKSRRANELGTGRPFFARHGVVKVVEAGFGV